MSNWDSLLAQWLDEHAGDRERHAKRALDSYAAFKDKATPYAQATKRLAEAHALSALVYRRALRDVEASR